MGIAREPDALRVAYVVSRLVFGIGLPVDLSMGTDGVNVNDDGGGFCGKAKDVADCGDLDAWLETSGMLFNALFFPVFAFFPNFEKRLIFGGVGNCISELSSPSPSVASLPSPFTSGSEVKVLPIL